MREALQIPAQFVTTRLRVPATTKTNTGHSFCLAASQAERAEIRRGTIEMKLPLLTDTGAQFEPFVECLQQSKHFGQALLNTLPTAV